MSSIHPTSPFFELLMQAALEEADRAAACDEVPVGAVIADGEKIIVRSHNLIETRKDSTAHAEILAIQEASRLVGNWRLSGLTLCVTLEPCAMCAGAIRLSRLGTVVYGASDPRAGAFESVYKIGADPTITPPPQVVSSIKKEQCAGVLRAFFDKKRKQKKSPLERWPSG